MQALHDQLAKDGFRLRGTAMSRIDGFSDVVFGFAITLLVVSLEVPHTFEELHKSLRGFVPFGICFLMLILIWYSHYKFFRRYGLHDLGTIAINATLLFVVLFFVYPLKFLFTVLSTAWITGDNSVYGVNQMPKLMMIYGVGFTAVYWLFAALYWNAWRQQKDLALNPVEIFLTKSSIVEYLGMSSVGLISIATAIFVPANLAGLAGFSYFLLSIVGPIHGRWERRHLANLQKPRHPH